MALKKKLRKNGKKGKKGKETATKYESARLSNALCHLIV